MSVNATKCHFLHIYFFIKRCYNISLTTEKSNFIKGKIMLEITNFRDGEILNCHCGRESDECLEITIEGIAPPQEHVTVNGVPARRHDRIFLADVKLTQKINRIVVSSDGYFGEKTLAITLVWDKRSYKRYCFFVDDCSFFLRKLTLDRPKSLFDEMFLGGLKKAHDKYGTKFLLNLFYHDDHHDFSICDVPEDYKEEFQANKDWLRLSFHAKSEFPDRPYQHASAEKLAADFDEVYNEVSRFAGQECFMAPVVIHWGMTNPENFSVLKERGVRSLAGCFLGGIARIGEKHSIQVTDIGYHYEKDMACGACDKHIFYDRFHDLYLFDNTACCNHDDVSTLQKKIASIAPEQHVITIMTHEQYTYPDYFNYIPDHLERIETACRLATEYGFKPAWYTLGLLGNNAWND